MTNKTTTPTMAPKAGVIGWPITHSRSPLIHGFWLNKYQLAGHYDKIPVAPENLETFISGMRAAGFSGINVTIPHKENVLKLADKTTPEARAIGAANTLWFEGNELIAGNTDGYGFITHLKKSAPSWSADEPAMVIGAGGAARAIIYALMHEGVPEIILTNRTRSRAEALAVNLLKQQDLSNKDHHPIKVIDWEEKDAALSRVNLLVNTTSLGMAGNPPLKLDTAPLPAHSICYDIVYAPLETDLLKSARQRGLIGVDGLGMLIHQAAPGFEKWFGIFPEVTAELTQHVIDDLA